MEDWSSEGFADFMACKYLEERFGPGLTASIRGGWKAGAESLQTSYYQKDPGIWKRMRPELRERLQRQHARTGYQKMLFQTFGSWEIVYHLPSSFIRSRIGFASLGLAMLVLGVWIKPRSWPRFRTVL